MLIKAGGRFLITEIPAVGQCESYNRIEWLQVPEEHLTYEECETIAKAVEMAKAAEALEDGEAKEEAVDDLETVLERLHAVAVHHLNAGEATINLTDSDWLGKGWIVKMPDSER